MAKKNVEVTQKIIDMTEVPDEKFAKIVNAFEEWKNDGMASGFGYWENEDLDNFNKNISKLFEKTFIKGTILGGVAAIAGVGACMIADYIVKSRKAKKNKEEIEEFIDVVESKL